MSENESNSEGETAGSSDESEFNYLKYILFFLLFWQFSFKVSNAAMMCLLRFLKFFILLIGNAFNSSPIVHIGNRVPLSISYLHKLININKTDFDIYVVCPDCDSIYEFDDCIERRCGNFESKHCKYVHFPNHPILCHRKTCNTLLLKKVRCKNGTNYRPVKCYPYMPLKKSIARLAKKKNFIKNCELWRERQIHQNILCDIYDGEVWETFIGNNFLTMPYHYLLTMNVDWFEPFERGVYSVGVIYLTVQNLPPTERNKPENIIVVGVIPGPREPKLTINSYLSPLVVELKQAWDQGFSVYNDKGTNICVKLALSCVACDIPASRKVCGFLSHHAHLGCNKCLKQFSTNRERTDYSGYDRENWVLRTSVAHRQNVQKVLEEVTKTGIQTAESKYGLRYSILLSLPYFDPVKHTAIDAMHNLFLGTGKHAFRTWIENEILDKRALRVIENRIAQFHVPPSVGRLPSNITACYGGFTAHQWKNWIAYAANYRPGGCYNDVTFPSIVARTPNFHESIERHLPYKII